jgi:hypothetical protein
MIDNPRSAADKLAYPPHAEQMWNLPRARMVALEIGLRGGYPGFGARNYLAPPVTVHFSCLRSFHDLGRNETWPSRSRVGVGLHG